MKWKTNLGPIFHNINSTLILPLDTFAQTTKKIFHICHGSNHFNIPILDFPIPENISILDSLFSENKFEINTYFLKDKGDLIAFAVTKLI